MCVCMCVSVCVVQPLLRLRHWKFSPRHRCCDWLSFSLLHACLPPVPLLVFLSFFFLLSRWWALYYRSCCQIKPVPTAHAPQYCPAAVKCLFSKSIINMKIKHFCHKCLFGFGTDRTQGFWEMSNADVLVNVNRCFCFVLQRARGCVSVAWLAVCVCVLVCVWVCTVLRDAAGSCACDVMTSCGFMFLRSLYSAWSSRWQPFEMSVIFYYYKN